RAFKHIDRLDITDSFLFQQMFFEFADLIGRATGYDSIGYFLFNSYTGKGSFYILKAPFYLVRCVVADNQLIIKDINVDLSIKAVIEFLFREMKAGNDYSGHY